MQALQASLQDVEAVMALVRRVIPVMRATGNLQWEEHYPNPGVFERDVNLNQLWLAEIDGRIAGVAAITTDQQPEYANVGWDIHETAIVVHRLAVDPAFQGKGVARERQIKVLRVDTNTQNEVTQRLFPRLGYTLAGETGFSFRPGLRFRCYEKRLS
jgi:RimJ/RimL family protein N-acetyltransferase